jgi:hypothetical protein
MSLALVTAVLAGTQLPSAARAGSVTVQSDANTLAAALGPGSPSNAVIQQLNSGNDTGLTYSPVLVGGFGSFTAIPPGAPAGTSVVNIAPGDGESGFFKVTFTLPTGFSGASLTGVGNVDDSGTVFLNGTAISPAIGDPASLSEATNQTFSTSDAGLFHAGENVLLVADANLGAGPSGAAFYATVTFNGSVVPEPTGLTLVGIAVLGCLRRARRRPVNDSRSAPVSILNS